jgi:UDP-N-acetylglucosamine--N-acetylmuramyl-(pentapeptide) pyrophosphoryl-undecaprenol N-acetylglucosamine transferase
MVPDGPQSRGLLGPGAVVHGIRDTGPRDLASALRNVPAALRVLRRVRPQAVVSTGAAVAVPLLTAARILGIETHYVESAARTEGPSVSGTLLARVPGVRTYSQWDAWSSPTWTCPGSVLDGFVVESVPVRPVRSAVVTLGTQQGYGFRRLVERLVGLLDADVEVLWQTGSTDVTGLAVAARARVAPDELTDAMRRADVVIAHAGVGSTLNALAAGRRPLLVPREAAFGEHVDDHQALIGRAVQARGLAVSRRVDELSGDDIRLAAAATTHRRSTAPLALRGSLGALLR